MRDTLAVLATFNFQSADERAQRYRGQAAAFRELAEAEQNPTFRSSLFEVAATYEQLADDASPS